MQNPVGSKQKKILPILALLAKMVRLLFCLFDLGSYEPNYINLNNYQLIKGI